MATFADRFTPQTRFWTRLAVASVLVFLTLATAGLVFLLQTKDVVFMAENQPAPATAPFPVGVDATAKTINEQPDVLAYLEDHFQGDRTAPIYVSWYSRLTAKLAMLDWYQTLASPESRILVVYPGERQGQVVGDISTIMHWSLTDRKSFAALIASSTPGLSDGNIYPGRYVVGADATPLDVAKVLNEQFVAEVLNRYTPDVAAKVPTSEGLTIASMLEREAYSFKDMRIISGIIWNRLFIGMRLQIDSTVQYAKGSRPNEPWWPAVTPSDLHIASAYNTYEHKGLPPGPIANASAAAIIAALNPVKTDCLYYFHDPHGNFYCSKTYAEHVAKLKQIFGQGK